MKCKDGLAYGMGLRGHVTYLLGNSLLKHWTVCCIYIPIIQLHLEAPAAATLIDSLSFLVPHHGFSFSRRVVNCSINEASSLASRRYCLQGKLASDLGWPDMERRLTIGVTSLGYSWMTLTFFFPSILGFIITWQFFGGNHIRSSYGCRSL